MIQINGLIEIVSTQNGKLKKKQETHSTGRKIMQHGRYSLTPECDIIKFKKSKTNTQNRGRYIYG